MFSCDIPLDLSNYWVPQMYVKKRSDGKCYYIYNIYNISDTTGKFHYLDNYMAVYYKLLNERGGMHPVNNPIQPGDFHSFPPGFRWTVHGEQEQQGHGDGVRMLAGSPLETRPQPAFINHKCMGDGFTEDTPGFPPRPELCTAYIRSH